jgi:hypothetical protein
MAQIHRQLWCAGVAVNPNQVRSTQLGNLFNILSSPLSTGVWPCLYGDVGVGVGVEHEKLKTDVSLWASAYGHTMASQVQEGSSTLNAQPHKTQPCWRPPDFKHVNSVLSLHAGCFDKASSVHCTSLLYCILLLNAWSSQHLGSVEQRGDAKIIEIG